MRKLWLRRGHSWLLLLYCAFQVRAPGALPGGRLNLSACGYPATADAPVFCVQVHRVCSGSPAHPGKGGCFLRQPPPALPCGSGIPTRCGCLSPRPADSGPSVVPSVPSPLAALPFVSWRSAHPGVRPGYPQPRLPPRGLWLLVIATSR